MSLAVGIHSHIIPPAINGAAGPHGPEFTLTESGSWMMRSGSQRFMLHAISHTDYESGKGGEDPREWGDRLSNPHRRLEEMNEIGLDAMVVTWSPPLYMYEIEAEYGIPYAQAYNDALAEYCAADPKRLYFLASLQYQDMAAATKEAERAIRELGARGVFSGATNLGGHELDDPAMFPLYELLVDAGLPLSIHPGSLGAGRHLVGVPGKPRELATIGFPLQEMRAIFTLIVGGVFDRFPDLKVCVSHGGGFFPYQFGRIEEFQKLEGDKRVPKKEIVEYIDNLYFDAVVHDVRARRLLVDVMGAEHVLLGSNYAGMDSVDGRKLVDELGLPEADQAAIRGENAKRIFKLDI